MMKEYTNVSGTNNDIIATDSEIIISELNKVDFQVNTTKEDYSDEIYTIDYIDNVFKAIDSVKETWQNLYNLTTKYHNLVDEVPLPNEVLNPDLYMANGGEENDSKEE